MGRAIGPSVTGNAIIQHLAKLRKKVGLEAARVRRSTGGYKNAKVAGTRTRATRAMTSSQDNQFGHDPDEGDPDESYGEQVKKRKSRGRKIKREEPSDQEHDSEEDEDHKEFASRPSKKSKKHARYNREQTPTNEMDEDSGSEEDSPSKASRRHKSNVHSESSTSGSESDEEFVAAGSHFLAFNKYDPNKAHRKVKKEDTDESEDIDSQKDRSKIISLRFNEAKSKNSLKKISKSLASSDEDEKTFNQEKENVGNFEAGQYVSPGLATQTIATNMPMPQAVGIGGMYSNAPGLQRGLFANPFNPGVAHGLPELTSEGRDPFAPHYTSGVPINYSSYVPETNRVYQHPFQDPRFDGGNSIFMHGTAPSLAVGGANIVEGQGFVKNDSFADDTDFADDGGDIDSPPADNNDEHLFGGNLTSFDHFMEGAM